MRHHGIEPSPSRSWHHRPTRASVAFTRLSAKVVDTLQWHLQKRCGCSVRKRCSGKQISELPFPKLLSNAASEILATSRATSAKCSASFHLKCWREHAGDRNSFHLLLRCTATAVAGSKYVRDRSKADSVGASASRQSGHRPVGPSTKARQYSMSSKARISLPRCCQRNYGVAAAAAVATYFV